jgi:hypothetical protein
MSGTRSGFARRKTSMTSVTSVTSVTLDPSMLKNKYLKLLKLL